MNNIWNKLLENNLVSGEKPDADVIQIPWYIRFMQGFAGWLAALFIMGFFAAAFSFLFRTPSGGMIMAVGILCSVGAYTVIRLQKNDFLDQLSMAFSLCGQLMFAIGLFFILNVDFKVAFFMLGIYQLILAWIIPQYAHRLLSTSFGLLSLLIFLNLVGFYGIGSALAAILFSFIWLKESSWGNKRELWDPVGYGVAITIVFSSGFLLTGKHLIRETIRTNESWLFNHAELISSLLIALLFVNLVVVLLKEHRIKFVSKTAILSLLAAAGLVLISFKIFGMSAGLIIVIIGFARKRLTLITLGAMSVVSFFSWYYYNLQATLLFKSITLMVLGAALIVGWFGINAIYGGKTSNKLKNIHFKVIKRNKWLAALTVFIAIVAINININSKEDLKANGEVLLFELAPVDPRSLMQGDYMRLRFALARIIQDKLQENNKGAKTPIHSGFAIVEKAENQVAKFVALYENQEISQNQYKVPYRMRRYQVVFTTDAFYFQEGKAKHYEQAEYGQFRISESGEMLLINMVDEKFKIL
ncbi:MAG: GDYXXLXY domain-containing protein [Marinicellaceae bacterium]